MSDDLLRARVDARRAELAADAGRRRRRRADPWRALHLRLWWAVRPRREVACLVTTYDGAAVLGGRRP